MVTRLLQQSAIMGSSFFRKLPMPVQDLFAKPIIHLLLQNIEKESLEFLEGKTLAIEVTDWKHKQVFTFNQGKIRIIDNLEQNDVTMKGNFHSFMALALHKEDPDTLFFQRKLLILGNTELGLEIKALFDQLSPEELPKPVRLLMEKCYAISG